MDREHPARLFLQVQVYVAKANGPRSAWLAPLPQALAHVATGGLQTRDPFGLFQTK
jgi:hypothetical protein